MTAESVRIQVIVSEETKAELDRQAAQDGVSLSAVARRNILAGLRA